MHNALRLVRPCLQNYAPLAGASSTGLSSQRPNSLRHAVTASRNLFGSCFDMRVHRSRVGCGTTDDRRGPRATFDVSGRLCKSLDVWWRLALLSPSQVLQNMASSATVVVLIVQCLALWCALGNCLWLVPRDDVRTKSWVDVNVLPGLRFCPA